ncbi:MAG: response regulator [Acidobacteriota bacterium]
MTGPEVGKRLLVVDDNEGMVATLEDILGAAGYCIDVAYSGHEAVERVKQRQPDGILMDIRMPGMNGVEAFREIKRLSPESFVIFMTAYAASALVEDAKQEGAIEVIAKPLDLQYVMALIIRTIRQAVERGRRRPEPQG